MAFREFTDAKGEIWKVWDVIPDQRISLKRRTPAGGMPGRAERAEAEAPGASEVTPSRESGWLAFQSHDENRRLSPIPPAWESATEGELAKFLERAIQVRNRYKT